MCSNRLYRSDMVPGLGRAAMLVYPEAQQSDRAFFLNPFEEAARSLGVNVVKGEVTGLQEIESVFASLATSGPAGAVVVTPHSSFANLSREIVALAARYNVPTSYPYRYYVGQGGLMSYGVNNIHLFRQAAPYVNSILRGAKPRDLPIQQPTRFDRRAACDDRGSHPCCARGAHVSGRGRPRSCTVHEGDAGRHHDQRRSPDGRTSEDRRRSNAGAPCAARGQDCGRGGVRRDLNRTCTVHEPRGKHVTFG